MKNTLISIYKKTNAYGFCVKKHHDGSLLKFPGLNPNVNLYQHQRDAVKRIISTPNTLFLDEAHNYKNISYRSRITGVMGAGGMGSERADGMLDKVQCVQRNNNV